MGCVASGKRDVHPRRMADIGAVWTTIEAGALLVQAMRATHARFRTHPAVKRMREIVEQALTTAVNAVGPEDVAVRERGFAEAMAVLESGDETAHYLLTLGSPDDRTLPDVADHPDLLARFREQLQADYTAELLRPVSPLAGQFVVASLLTLLERTEGDAAVAAGIELGMLPPPVARHLRDADTAAPAATAACVAALTTSDVEPAARAAALVAALPSWLATGPWELWAAIAEHAASFQDAATASTAYAEVAARAPSRKATWFARAALATDHATDRPESLVEQARTADPTDDETRFVDFVAEAITYNRNIDSDDPNAFRADVVRVGLRALAEGTAVRNVVAVSVAKLLIGTDVDAAIATLHPIVEQDPDAATAALVLADALIARADSEHAGSRQTDSLAAYELALRARTSRRAWGGDSAAAAATMCSAAAVAGRWDLVRAAGRAEIDATIDEAADPKVRRLAGLADINLGGEATDPDEDTRGLAEAGRRASAGDTGEAIGILTEVASRTPDVTVLGLALRLLAALGASTLPRLDVIAGADAEHAAVLSTVAAVNGGSDPGALGVLRSMARRSRLAAMALTQQLADDGERAGAAAVARRAGERLNDPMFLLRAGDLYAAAGDRTAAELAIAHGLDLAPKDSPERRDLRRLALEVASNAQDSLAVARAARAAIVDGDNDERVRWALVNALMNLRRHRHAWEEARREPPLDADTSWKAERLLQLQARAAPDRVDLAADILDRWADDRDVHLVGCILFFGADHDDLPIPQPVVARMQAHLQRFTDTYPEDTAIRTVSTPEGDASALADELKAQLEAGNAANNALRRHIDLAALGQLPFGLLMELRGPGYIEGLVAIDQIGFVCSPADPAVTAAQLAAARDAIGGPIVVDPSALAVGSFIPDTWDRVAGAFTDVSMGPRGQAQLDDLLFRKAGNGRVVLDPATDQIRIADWTDDELTRMRERRQWMRTRGGELDSTGAVALPAEFTDAERDATWIEAFAAAKATGRALWTDDAGTALLAIGEGVPAFGTVALLAALGEAGHIANEDANTALDALYRAGAVDLPVPPEALPTLAARGGWELAPAVVQLGRPHRWVTAPATMIAVTETIVRELVAAGHEGAPAEAVHSITTGLLRVTDQNSAADAVGAITGALIATLDLNGQAAANAVAAVRHGCATRDTPGDPLIPLVEAVIAQFEGDGAAINAHILNVLRDLPPEDLRVVTQHLLQIDVASLSARETLRQRQAQQPRPE